MKRIVQMIAVLTLAVGCYGSAALAQSGNEKIIAEIMKREAEYIEGAKKGPNLPDFDRFYAESYMVTARIPPRILTKAESYAIVKDPKFRPGTIESFTNTDVKVRAYGDSTAIVTGHWERTSRDADGKDNSASGRFTRVWVRENGKWMIAAQHYSPDIDLEKLRARSATAPEKKN